MRSVNVREEPGRKLGGIGRFGPRPWLPRPWLPRLGLSRLGLSRLGLSRLALPTPALSRLELIGAVTLLAAAIVPVQVHAQIPPPVNAVPQGSPIPRILPLAPPSVSPGVPVLPPPAPSTEVPIGRYG